MEPTVRVPLSENPPSESPLGKRSSMLASPSGKRANNNSKEFRRPSSLAQPSLDAPSTPAPVETIKEEEASSEEMAKQMVEAVDSILSMAFKMERLAKEAEEDEALPTNCVLTRCGSNNKVRARRKSRELEAEFQRVMAARLESVFKHFDADGNGTLDASELTAAFEAAGRPADEETIQKAIVALDENNDGLISLEEFKAIAWKCATG